MKLTLSLILSAFFLSEIGIPIAGNSQTLSSPPTSGMVGWWKGNGDATDSSGNGHNGTLEGMGFTTGISGQAFAAGSNRRVLIPDTPAFYLTSLTIAAWVNPTAFGYIVLARGDARPGLDPYVMSLNSASGIAIILCDATNNSVALSAPSPLPYNVWSHVAGTFDATSGDMRVYVNGALVAETNTTIRPFGALDPTQAPGLDIGNVQGADFPFQGAIEQVFLYSRALSSNEVRQLAQFTCSPHTARATATVVNGFVVGAGITDSGCGYSNTPAVVIQGGGGSGATATAVVSNGVVSGITITDAGVGYTNTPTVYIYSPFGLQIGLVKSVRPSFADLLLGVKYQLQISPDLNLWTNTGSAFTATNSTMVFSQYFDVDNFNQYFFRLQEAP
jgi:hypothetical protein